MAGRRIVKALLDRRGYMQWQDELTLAVGYNLLANITWRDNLQ